MPLLVLMVGYIQDLFSKVSTALIKFYAYWSNQKEIYQKFKVRNVESKRIFWKPLF